MLQANFSTWRGHTVGMWRTLTALGVLYHNYSIINTPPPLTREGLHACMGWREDGWRWQGCTCWAGVSAVSAIQTLQRKLGSITSTLILKILFVCFFKHTVVPGPFPWEQEKKSHTDTRKQYKTLANNNQHNILNHIRLGVKTLWVKVNIKPWKKKQACWAT